MPDIGAHADTPYQVIAPFESAGNPPLTPGAGGLLVRIKPWATTYGSATIAVDGAPVAGGKGGALVALSAGEHILEFWVDKSPARSALVTVRPGEVTEFEYNCLDELRGPALKSGLRGTSKDNRSFVNLVALGPTAGFVFFITAALIMILLRVPTSWFNVALLLPMVAAPVGLPMIVISRRRRRWRTENP